MSLDLDPNVDKGRAKTVRLAGADFVIVPLPLRQVLAIADILPKLQGVNAGNISSEKFAPAIDLILCGLKKAYPQLTRDDLLDLPIGLGEIMDAIPVIILQSGGKIAEPAAGEAAAASPTNPPTGADSSQI